MLDEFVRSAILLALVDTHVKTASSKQNTEHPSSHAAVLLTDGTVHVSVNEMDDSTCH